MRDYKKLEIWKRAHLLTKQIYQTVLPLMPTEERFALTSQLRRSAYSIPLNIVEGCGKNTNKCFIQVQKLGKKLLITSIIDNLTKGASGQAVQNMNLLFGFDETAGLKLKATGF